MPNPIISLTIVFKDTMPGQEESYVRANFATVLTDLKNAGFNGIRFLLDTSLTMPDPVDFRGGSELDTLVTMVQTVLADSYWLEVKIGGNGMERETVLSKQDYYYPLNMVKAHYAEMFRRFGNDARLILTPNDWELYEWLSMPPIPEERIRDATWLASTLGALTQVELPSERRTEIIDAWKEIRDAVHAECPLVRVYIQDLAVTQTELPQAGDVYPNMTDQTYQNLETAFASRFAAGKSISIDEAAPMTGIDICALIRFAKAHSIESVGLFNWHSYQVSNVMPQWVIDGISCGLKL